MSNLVDMIRSLQRCVGEAADGVFGPATAAAVLRELQAAHGVDPGPVTFTHFDPRSAATAETLDDKALQGFLDFYLAANATAATYGCSYIMLSGNRTWAEQDALYAQGRTQPGEIVTRAKGGQSNHNFGIAADFGVFMGKSYLDESKPGLAEKVHRACSLHAASCGLEWGGSWESIVDLPHYECATGLTLAQKRNVYQLRGSVL